jgi:hypothetical protein
VDDDRRWWCVRPYDYADALQRNPPLNTQASYRRKKGGRHYIHDDGLCQSEILLALPLALELVIEVNQRGHVQRKCSPS